MASSFYDQIPDIINIIIGTKPKTILDVGKGFGKYGFLAHEYFGINNTKQINPQKTMAQNSDVAIDAIEVDETLIMPHLSQFYRNVYFGDVFEQYKLMQESYDLVIMIDVVEHLEKVKTLELIKDLITKNTIVLVATPINFFNQHLYESVYEEHISHWTIKDFQNIGSVQVQYKTSGAIYLISNTSLNIPGFGNSLIKKIKRIARLVVTEFKHL